nr:winged helix-turn-helix domain-containing protein [Candidatus Sigynarchaeota archaeon]
MKKNKEYDKAKYTRLYQETLLEQDNPQDQAQFNLISGDLDLHDIMTLDKEGMEQEDDEMNEFSEILRQLFRAEKGVFSRIFIRAVRGAGLTSRLYFLYKIASEITKLKGTFAKTPTDPGIENRNLDYVVMDNFQFDDFASTTTKLVRVKCLIIGLSMRESLKLHEKVCERKLEIKPERAVQKFYMMRGRSPRILANIANDRLDSLKINDPPWTIPDLFGVDVMERLMRGSIYNPARFLRGIGWFLAMKAARKGSSSEIENMEIINAWLSQQGLITALFYLRYVFEPHEEYYKDQLKGKQYSDDDQVHFPRLHESKVEILKKIDNKINTPTTIARALGDGKTVSAISMQLAVLRDLHLVEVFISDRNRIYTLTEGGEAMVDFLLEAEHCRACKNKSCKFNCDGAFLVEKDQGSTKSIVPCKPGACTPPVRLKNVPITIR